jgi:hypothetical protein
MMTKSELLKAIETFCADTGMAETTFGRKAVNDGKFVGRIREGGRVWPETIERVEAFIAEQKAVAA